MRPEKKEFTESINPLPTALIISKNWFLEALCFIRVLHTCVKWIKAPTASLLF